MQLLNPREKLKITKHRFKKSKVYSDVRNVEQKFLMAQRFVVLVEL